jgi:hypothetical protein
MAQLYKKITAICPSRLVNAWCVNFSSGKYIITPAHVAVHIKNGIYTRSTFLNELSHLSWHVPRSYSGLDYSFSFDCAWAKLPDDQESQDSFAFNISHSMDCDIFFRQPYDEYASWDGSQSVLGSVKAQVYPSPRSQLLEALDIGFKGMSGALVTSDIDGQSKVIGMLLRRGNPIDLSNTSVINKQHSTVTTFINDSVIHHEEYVSAVTPNDGSVLSLIRQMNRKLEILDRKIDNLEKKFEDLEKKVLTTDDLDRLLHVTAMRRSIIMPCSRIEHLMKDGVNLNLLEGKIAE